MEQLGQFGWAVPTVVLGVLGWLSRRAFEGVVAGINELKQDVKEMRELSGDHAVQIGIHAESIRTIREELAELRRKHG